MIIGLEFEARGPRFSWICIIYYVCVCAKVGGGAFIYNWHDQHMWKFYALVYLFRFGSLSNIRWPNKLINKWHITPDKSTIIFNAKWAHQSNAIGLFCVVFFCSSLIQVLAKFNSCHDPIHSHFRIRKTPTTETKKEMSWFQFSKYCFYLWFDIK